MFENKKILVLGFARSGYEVSKVLIQRNNEVVLTDLKNDDKMKEWYKYLYSGIIYNVWGTTCMCHADSDKNK